MTRIERIVALHHDHGWLCEEIGWMLGVSGQVIANRLRRAGHPARGTEILVERNRERLLERAERVRYFYEKGEGLHMIAFRLDIGKTTVAEDLERIGVARRSKTHSRHGWRRAASRDVEFATGGRIRRAKRIRRAVDRRG